MIPVKWIQSPTERKCDRKNDFIEESNFYLFRQKINHRCIIDNAKFFIF